MNICEGAMGQGLEQQTRSRRIPILILRPGVANVYREKTPKAPRSVWWWPILCSFITTFSRLSCFYCTCILNGQTCHPLCHAESSREQVKGTCDFGVLNYLCITFTSIWSSGRLIIVTDEECNDLYLLCLNRYKHTFTIRFTYEIFSFNYRQLTVTFAVANQTKLWSKFLTIWRAI